MEKKHISILGLIIVIAIIGIISFGRLGEEKKQNQDFKKDNVENKKNDYGMVIDVLKEGTGDKLTANGDSISVHYTGMFLDGKKFDSSLDRGVPFKFTLGAGQVIKGWDTGLLDMKVGEKRRLTIPSDLAYGKNGYPGAIPPNATLIFEVELISIN